MERYRSGQTGQTVNLLAQAFGGSNPPLSRFCYVRLDAHVAQLVEHFLGKEEVTGSIPVMGCLIIKKGTS